MTHPLLSCRPHPRYLLGGSKNPPASIKLPALLTQDINWIDGETRVPLHCLFALGGDPPTCRELTSDALPSSSIEKHCVLLLVCCACHP